MTKFLSHKPVFPHPLRLHPLSNGCKLFKIWVGQSLLIFYIHFHVWFLMFDFHLFLFHSQFNLLSLAIHLTPPPLCHSHSLSGSLFSIALSDSSTTYLWPPLSFIITLPLSLSLNHSSKLVFYLRCSLSLFLSASQTHLLPQMRRSSLSLSL